MAADLASYPEWAVEVRRVEIHERDIDGRPARVTLTIDAMIRQVSTTFRYVYDPPRSMSWSAEPGPDIEELEGSYEFSPAGEGTSVVYALRVVPALRIFPDPCLRHPRLPPPPSRETAGGYRAAGSPQARRGAGPTGGGLLGGVAVRNPARPGPPANVPIHLRQSRSGAGGAGTGLPEMGREEGCDSALSTGVRPGLPPSPGVRFRRTRSRWFSAAHRDASPGRPRGSRPRASPRPCRGRSARPPGWSGRTPHRPVPGSGTRRLRG